MSLTEIKNEIFRKGYNIGFFDAKYLNSSDEERNRKVVWLDMNDYKVGWFADPFFLGMDSKNYYLLVEEFVYATNKGRLVKLTISKTGCRLEKVDVILELETHLSFPIIIREEDTIYVYPENYQSGNLNLYSYNQAEDKLVFVKTIIEEPLLDTQIMKLNDKYYAFGIKWVTNTQDDTKHLMVFESPSLFGPYTHIQTINNKKNEERGAGVIFNENGNLFRPAQCCEGGYGKAVILYNLFFDKGNFREKEVKRLIPDGKKKYGKVLHTINVMDGICVIDGYDYAHPTLVKIADFIGGLFGKVRKVANI